MKNFQNLSFLTLSMALLLSACEGKQEQPQPQKEIQANSLSHNRKVIHSATWEEWGHASANCRGWGLCRYQDCWFCEPLDGSNRGTVVFDDETKKGHLIIELDPSKTIQNEAIQNKSLFYVDEDIDNPNSVLQAGKYAYDASVGPAGGYMIPIRIK